MVMTLVIDSALYFNKVHAGVSMADQSLGGSTYDEAVNLVDQRVKVINTQPVTLVKDTKQWTVTPEQMGQIVDIDASVTAAMQVTRQSNVVKDLARRLKLYFGPQNLSLVGEIDQEKVDAFIAEVAGELDVPPVNQSLSVEGDNIEAIEGTSGVVVDREKLEARLLDAFFSHSTAQIEVPMTTKAPEAMGSSTDEAITMVQTMLSGDVTLTYLAPLPAQTTATTIAGAEQTAAVVEQQTATTMPPETTSTTIVETAGGTKMTFISETKTFTPAELRDLLDFRADEKDGTSVLVPYISSDKLAPFLHRIEGPMTVPALNASFKSDVQGFFCSVVPGHAGKGLDHEATAAALTAAALSADDRAAEVVVKDIEPELTTEEAEAMGINTPLGSSDTIYEGKPERAWNVRLATARATNTDVQADTINWKITTSGSVLLAPGEEFDFAKLVGPRTAQAGFLGAVGIQDGQYVDGILGGGICQVSTAIFNAALQAGLKITERHNHSIYIDHYPRGADATVTSGGEPKNLRFVNDTPNFIWIYGWSNGIRTIVTIFGTSDGRKASITCSEPYEWSPKPQETSTVLDPEVPWGETSIAFAGQDAFKLTLTRVIQWPDGHKTSEEWYSEWEAKAAQVAFPTSTTLGPNGSPTATTIPTP